MTNMSACFTAHSATFRFFADIAFIFPLMVFRTRIFSFLVIIILRPLAIHFSIRVLILPFPLLRLILLFLILIFRRRIKELRKLSARLIFRRCRRPRPSMPPPRRLRLNIRALLLHFLDLFFLGVVHLPLNELLFDGFQDFYTNVKAID